ncbi:archaellin/type IV pilin N-terminal domain-containing protein [Saccharolobus shibatae]|uniref:Uncharacterized protein n=1 Tax=Saccharolobus shibatae TaxID=2286 RepID=A0A8F5BY79_9CREN|nr:archaellin/type IV pilin N-terminal domain-containing protein [Saccharolobus shibatae]QXJ30651.1 hypothetical protein J5U21_00300 [Saccharolobus shibatae]QXJ33679.1 hypothetical protein J5U22_00224 [Saccharolobus shibatae]
MKKGISSILGAIIIIQIVVLSVGLILYLTSLNAKMSSIAYSQIHEELQNTPISVIPTYQGPMILSTSASHLAIKYIIYPNGQIIPVNVPITQNGVYINFDNFPWAVIILNDGNWYNISSKDELQYPNMTLFGGIEAYNPNGNPNITPAGYGYSISLNNWNLFPASPNSYTPYGIRNAIIYTSSNGTIPLLVNLTASQQNYFDIIIPYEDQLPIADPQYSYYLPLEFTISYNTYYLIPVYNVTFKVVSPHQYGYFEYYYVTLSYVTYNMIYFMNLNNDSIHSYWLDIQLVDYKFLGYLVTKNIDFGYVELGVWTPLVSPYVVGVPIPGYNNYTLSDNAFLNANYNVLNFSSIYGGAPIIEPISYDKYNPAGPQYFNTIDMTENRTLAVVMTIDGGNVDYNLNWTPIINIMNYTYFWYFLNPQINPDKVNLIVSITPNSQITIALRDNGELIYPNFAYIAYTLAEKYSVTHNYVGLNGGPPLTIVKDYATGTLINASNEGYLPLGYPVVSANYQSIVIPQNYYQYTETATYQYFRTTNSQIEYNLPFIIMIPDNVYYPYLV